MNYHHLTRKERGMISQYSSEHVSIREMARRLKRDASTISREIRRNKSQRGYKANYAHACYIERRQLCCRTMLFKNEALAEYVTDKLLLTWSPEQIAGRIRLDYPDDQRMRISHTSIYRWLKYGFLPQSAQLSTKLRHYGHKHGETRGKRVGMRELKTRCREVLRRSRLGDWEVDTVVFGERSKRGHILNMTERKSRYCCLAILRNTRKEDLLRAFSFFLEDGRLPILTMTSDRGAEFNCHSEFEERFGSLYYYTRPASPWQKPTVENTNGLIRQFFPRGIGFHEIDDSDVAHVMYLLNNRPRKSLAWKTPAEVISP